VRKAVVGWGFGGEDGSGRGEMIRSVLCLCRLECGERASLWYSCLDDASRKARCNNVSRRTRSRRRVQSGATSYAALRGSSPRNNDRPGNRSHAGRFGAINGGPVALAIRSGEMVTTRTSLSSGSGTLTSTTYRLRR